MIELSRLSKEQGVPSRRQCIRQSDSHDVFGVDNQGLRLPKGIRNSVGDIVKPACSFYDCSTTEATSTNNVGPVDLSSLGGCLPDANVTGDCSSKTTTLIEDINVPNVSSSDNCMPRADVTGFFSKH
uniref:Uncharacterized protein n=1 Tax=Tanacetum cinerariifolium TaxID=118510 RepID=A0A6L2L3F2_TANCI|nr:hypothetical protein [Tanacetum cinerariifolium]